MALRRRIREVRGSSFVVAIDGDIAPGISAVGAPICDPGGAIVAAVSLSGLSSQIYANEAEMIDAVVEAAATISRELGQSPS